MLTLTTDLLPFRLSGNPAFVTVNTNKGSEPNIRIECEVFYKSGINWISAGIDALTPDASGNCTYELSEYFGNHILPGFTFPETGSVVKIISGASRQFKIVFKEYYGTTPALTHTLTNPTIYYIVKGKIFDHFTTLFTQAYSSFHNMLQTNMRLSLEPIRAISANKPIERRAAKADMLKIFGLAKDYLGNINVLISIFCTDGTTIPWFLSIPTNFTPEKGDVFELQCGYNRLGIDAYIAANFPGKTALYYVVIIADSVMGYITPHHKIILDQTYYPNRREFIFLNSLGAYDTFVATGRSESEIEYSYQVVDTPFWPSAALSSRKNVRTDTFQTIKCNTGFISKDVLEWLPELFTSTEVYEIVNGALVPVVISPATILRHSDETGLYSVEFEYQQAPVFINDSAEAADYVSLAITIAGYGSVRVDGIPYSAPLTIEKDSSVLLQALPPPYFTFDGWTGDLISSNAEETIVMNANKTIAATFSGQAPGNSFLLTINRVGLGFVLVNNALYTEPVEIEAQAQVTLIAYPYNGWNFSAWSGDESGSSQQIQFTMNANKTINATFVPA